MGKALSITLLQYSWKLLISLHCNQLQIKRQLLLNLGMHQFAVRPKITGSPTTVQYNNLFCLSSFSLFQHAGCLSFKSFE